MCDLVCGDQAPQGLAPTQRLGSGVRVFGSTEQPGDPGVSAVPGATALTRIPSAAWSAAMARVSARTAPLLAL